MTARPARAERGDRAIHVSLAVGAVGLVLCGLGLLVDARQAYISYLAAYAAALSVVLGALTLVMISYVMRAAWFVVVRRLTQNVAATLPVFAALFLPIVFGLRELYPWVAPGALDAEAQRRILVKHAYLNVPFFVVRAAIYFAVWLVLALLLRRWSLRESQGATADVRGRQRALSAGGLPALALTLTFASFDWLMSLTPEWYSTIYGVYVFAGGFVAAYALVALLAWRSGRSGRITDADAAEHSAALGKLLLTFVIFWAYIAFSQYLIIWIGDIPAEVTWYASRTRGSWGVLAIVLIVGHFALPFLVLLSHDLKRVPAAMAAVGGWLLVMHYLDVYWLVEPVLHPAGMRPHWLDLAAIAGVGGVAVAYGMWQLRGLAATPDATLERSLEYGRP